MILAAAAGGANGMQSIIMLVLVMVVFYFFMIRPQMKKQKEVKKFREGMKVGDKIVTIGGVHGKIVSMQETTVVVNSEGSQLRFEKSAISKTGGDLIGQN
jgi:preprotein translocase subunit YajC